MRLTGNHPLESRGKHSNISYYFYINGKLKKLIEYHGKQHFGCPKGSWSSGYGNLVENDIRKREYCNRNGIKLVTIPFDRAYNVYDILE